MQIDKANSEQQRSHSSGRGKRKIENVGEETKAKKQKEQSQPHQQQPVVIVQPSSPPRITQLGSFLIFFFNSLLSFVLTQNELQQTIKHSLF